MADVHPPGLRASSLLGRHVVDADGRMLGRVHDLRLRRDGPIQPGFGHALRLDALLVGRTSVANRLGFDLPTLEGPWPLHVLGRRAARHTRAVPWDAVVSIGDIITCSCRYDDLEPAYP